MALAGADSSLLTIETDLDAGELRDRLRAWEPWQWRIEFSNGVSTAEFEHGEPFVDDTLAVFRSFAKQLPAGLEGGTALDIGCRIGHNSLQLSREHGVTVTGVDASAQNIDIARYLAEAGQIDSARFHLADPNQFLLPDRFDLILHVGSLELLRDPFLALRHAVQMLRPGGCLVLEHASYRDPNGDGTLCRFHPHLGPQDRGKPWWSLGPAAVSNMLRAAGCARIQVNHESPGTESIYRRVVMAYRSGSAPDAATASSHSST